MKIGIHCAEVTAELVLRELETFATLCARLYLARRDLPRVDLWPGVRYRPDHASSEIMLVAPDVWPRTGLVVSCGTAAGAYAGWQRSRGAAYNVRAELVAEGRPVENGPANLPVRSVGVWHAVAVHDRGIVWDPQEVLPR